MLRLSSAFFLLLIGLSTAQAKTVTESFTSSSRKSTSEMVWNLSRGELHPPLLVTGWTEGADPNPDKENDVGDGRHGAFVRSRYSQFSTGGNTSGQIIRIDTDVFSNLQFTDFNLQAGWTIRASGSLPLIIRVQGNVIVNGTIDCSGENGEDAISDPTAIRLGGAGHCGGGDGGRSVVAGVGAAPVNSGQGGGIFVTGGTGGNSDGYGGGGGGSYIIDEAIVPPDKPNALPGQDENGLAIGGFAGINHQDYSFTDDINGAGSGGGGGRGFDGLPVEDSSGAGGGGGGGSIQFYVAGDFTVGASGNIWANGGAGGAITQALRQGGAGGGGAGGSILIFAGGDIVNSGVNLIAIRAQAGSGGLSTAGGAGGDGDWGRTWLTDQDSTVAGNLEDPQYGLDLPGTVQYETGVPYEVLSKVFDIGNTKPTFTSIDFGDEDVGAGVANFELAFSDEENLSSFPVFSDHLTFVGVQAERYARFRLSVTNADPAVPVRITDLNWQYDGNVETDFQFSTGCGESKSNAQLMEPMKNVAQQFLYWIFFLLPLLFVYHSKPK